MSSSACDIEVEAWDSKFHSESLRVKIDYYRSSEYHINPMSTRCSSRRRNSTESHNGTSRPEEGALHRKRRTRERQSRREAGNSVDNRNEPNDRDIIDIICDMQDETCLYDVDKGKSAALSSKEVDDSDSSSIASGPSSVYPSHDNRLRSLQDFCSACQKLYRRAEKMKTPIPDKLLDNDPNSLTCDQWVLNKVWRPRRPPNARGKLLAHVKLVKRRLRTVVGQNSGESSACLRPHTFLKRNLRRCAAKKKQQKKKRWRKRSGGYSQGSAVAKRRRLHGNRPRLGSRRARDTSDSDSNGSLSLERLCNQKRQEGRHWNAEVSLSPVALETTVKHDVASEEKTPKKNNRFLGLLAQLRGNSSMIVRETR